MGKHIKLQAGAKVTSVRLRLANNGGVVVSVENRVPSVSKNTYDDGWSYSPDYELAFTTYLEAEPAIKEAAELMGAAIEVDDDGDYEDDM
jgi:hypothetical protein